MIKARRDKTLWSEAEKRLGLREPGPEQERREASRILIMKITKNRLALNRYLHAQYH